MTRTDPRVVTLAPTIHLDVARALAYTGDDAATCGLLQLVEQSLGSDVDAIWHHLEAGDALAVGRALHVMKGFVPVFCKDALHEDISNLETLAKAEEMPPLKSAFAELASKLLELRSEIQCYLAASPPCTENR